MKKLYIFFGIITSIAFLLCYYLFNPAVYSFFPQCPFHKLTGLDCPGCGSQRAIHCLLNGNLIKAMDYNLMLVISLPFLFINSVYTLCSFFKHKKIRWRIIDHPLTPKIILLLVICFWILRNIPIYPLTYLAA